MIFDALEAESVVRKHSGGSRNEKKWPRKNSLRYECKLSPVISDVVVKKNAEKFNFFEDEQVKLTGSIFGHRENMDDLKLLLPKDRLNGFNIKLEDDCPQGGDDVRLSVLKALGTHNYRTIPCVLCLRPLVVYDRYPLVDGTLFLSPVQHSKEPVCMKLDLKYSYLHAICVSCMHTKWSCARCEKNDWFLGSTLVVGTLYTYDVLSTSLCCPPICRICLSPILMTDWQRSSIEKLQGNFQILVEQSPCSGCGQQDYHCIRRTDSFKLSNI
uniref:Headcase domain-containing protein n=1 Tax=Syphacia muris TaxID=451379 RepID=A0A0N5AIF7_9BILA